MKNLDKFFIGGSWVVPSSNRTCPLVDPATETRTAEVPLGSEVDVDRAVAAARAAFPGFSGTTREERLQLLQNLLVLYEENYERIAGLMTREMGTPLTFSRDAQAQMGRIHIEAGIEALERFEFDVARGNALLAREPIGVVGLITPWNWPMHQLMLKVVPALAVGCTVVVKPSEYSPLSAVLVAELIERAGFPAGVYNHVQGLGAEVGAALSRHPDVDMISFTGSTRAGVAVARDAALTVKRVSQELGGKSPNIILPDADFQIAVTDGVNRCFINAGQACSSPSRMLVPIDRMDEAADIAAARANAVRVGPARRDGDGTRTGRQRTPVCSHPGPDRSRSGGGSHACGGRVGPPGRDRRRILCAPDRVLPCQKRHADRPRGDIRAGPVHHRISRCRGCRPDRERHALRAGGLHTGTRYRPARALARRLRVGSVFINEAAYDPTAPFGGYKQSGNGREGGEYGFEEYLELKTIGGYAA